MAIEYKGLYLNYAISEIGECNGWGEESGWVENGYKYGRVNEYVGGEESEG